LTMKLRVTLLLLIALSSSSLIIVELTTSQVSPTIPEFTMTLEDRSHDVVNASGTYHIEIKFIDVIIRNTVPYSFYSVVNDSIVKLYYNVHIKGHSQDWAEATISGNLAPQDNNTTVKFGLGSTNPDPGGYSIWLGNITNESQADFQVRSVNGFYTKVTDEWPHCWRNPNFSIFNETGRSPWSDTQTITLPTGLTSESATSTPTGILSTANLFLPVSIIVATAIIAILATALTYLMKHGKQKPNKIS
jgi:hypothetical protein